MGCHLRLRHMKHSRYMCGIDCSSVTAIFKRRVSATKRPATLSDSSKQKSIDSLMEMDSTLESLQPTLEHVRDAFEQSMYRRSIELATSGMNKLIPFLDIRAAAYGLAGDFENGMRDAELLMQLTPNLPTGYLRAGELCSLLGYQLRAMGIYMQGITNLCSQHRDILQHRYNAAKVKSGERIDILGRAPYDIVANIVERLSLKEKVRLLKISERWCCQLSECSSLWSVMTIKHTSKLKKADISLLMDISHCIRKFCLHNLTSNLCEAILLGIMNSNFCNLEQIVIDDCDIRDHPFFFKTLESVSRTLKRLELDHLDSYESVIPFKTAVSTCPNLEYFRYFAEESLLTEQSAGLLRTARSFKLADLTLVFDNVEVEAVEDFLRCCPALRRLELQYCPSRIVEAVNLYCKNLVRFFFNNCSSDAFTTRIESAATTRPSAGIRTLSIGIESPSNFMSLFTDHHVSLESLSLTLNVSPDATWMSLLDTFTSLSNVRFLELACVDENSCDAAAMLFQKLPALTRLRFTSDGMIIGTDLVRATVRLPALQILEIYAVEPDDREIVYLLQSLAAKEKKSTLQTLKLQCVSRTACTCNYMLEYVPGIPTLQEFSIAQCGSITPSMIDSCFEQMRLHPSIEIVKLENVSGVTDGTMKRLAAIRKLKCVKLNALNHVTKYGLKAFNNSVTVTYDDVKV